MTNLFAFFRPLVKICLYSGIVFLTLSANAQSYYPAGLGNGNLQLWLTAADPTTLLTTAGAQATNGNSVATWKDKSGRGADAMGVISYSPIGILTFGEPSSPVTLYPVPTKDILHISAPGISEARNIDVVSIAGQVLESYSISNLDGSTLSVNRLLAGSYFVRIRGGGSPSCCHS